MTYTVTVYQSGNSKVITIPAKLGIKAGEKFTLDVKDDGYLLQKKKLTIEEQLQQIDNFAANALSGPFPKELNDPQKLDDFMEGVYD